MTTVQKVQNISLITCAISALMLFSSNVATASDDGEDFEADAAVDGVDVDGSVPQRNGVDNSETDEGDAEGPAYSASATSARPLFSQRGLAIGTWVPPWSLVEDWAGSVVERTSEGCARPSYSGVGSPGAPMPFDGGYRCLSDPADPDTFVAVSEEGEPVEVSLSRSEAARLLVDTGEATMDGMWQLANMPVLLWTTAEEHVVTDELLGFPVQVRFTPVEHVWDPMDGSGAFSSGGDPGAPYPNHTVSYPYPDGHESIHVELTTQWEAEFMVVGLSDWEAIEGTIPITTRTEDFEVREREVRLVPECAVDARC